MEVCCSTSSWGIRNILFKRYLIWPSQKSSEKVVFTSSPTTSLAYQFLAWAQRPTRTSLSLLSETSCFFPFLILISVHTAKLSRFSDYLIAYKAIICMDFIWVFLKTLANSLFLCFKLQCVSYKETGIFTYV
jgi:hypothetical protein